MAINGALTTVRMIKNIRNDGTEAAEGEVPTVDSNGDVDFAAPSASADSPLLGAYIQKGSVMAGGLDPLRPYTNGDGILVPCTVQGIIDVATADASYGGIYQKVNTGTLIDSDASIYGTKVLRPRYQSFQWFKVAIPSGNSNYDDCRRFIGWTDRVPSAMNSADAPSSGAYVGIQYSSTRGDAHWQLVYADGGTQTIISTGIGKPNSIMYVVLQSHSNTTGSSNISIQILDIDKAVLYSNLNIIGGNLPAYHRLMYHHAGVRSHIVSGSKELNYYGSEIQMVG